MTSIYHKPVLLEESIEALNVDTNTLRKNGLYVDVTLGGGGHTKKILEKLDKGGRLFVFDKDTEALSNVPKDKRVIAIKNNFRFIQNYIELYCYEQKDAVEKERPKNSLTEKQNCIIDGIVADLGVSSHQFDTAERGFSYRFDAPLDMRMDKESKLTAENILATYSKEELKNIFSEYGELFNAETIASKIKSATEPITTTGELCQILKSFYSPESEKKFLSKVFQALRIEVNNEMEVLKELLIGCENVLKSGGRLSVITYHSLEDRIVKNFFKEGKLKGVFELITKKPIVPSQEEIKTNGRSRSAKLRVVEKI